MNVFVRRTRPRPRPKAYDLYWVFTARRQEVFENRLKQAEPPWTTDSVLQTYKFCNVFRASDRVSQYMIRKVIEEQSDGTVADRLFRIVAFRTFSNIATWDRLTDLLGHSPDLEDLRSGRFRDALDRIKKHQGLYTGAFILCATKAYGFDQKHHNHVALFQEMFLKRGLAEQLLQARSLRDVVLQLQSFPLTGPFMAYQTAIDLNYSSLINFSENDYTQPGPGAVRGLAKAFEDLGDYSPAEAIMMMVEQQDAEFSRLGLEFRGLWGRSLHGIDCQGLFCELDKYCRETLPELKSNRSRIKAKFTPSTDELVYFFPPKWELNKKMVAAPHRLAPSPRLFSLS